MTAMQVNIGVSRSVYGEASVSRSSITRSRNALGSSASKATTNSCRVGRWSFGHAFNPFTSPSQSWVRMKLPSLGISIG